MQIERVRLKMLEDITLNLSDINDTAQDEVEKEYLEEEKKKLEAQRDELAKVVAGMIGKLSFYYEEINTIEERLKHFYGGENDGETQND